MMQLMKNRVNAMSMRRENYIEKSDEESEEDDKEQLCV